MGKSGGEGGGAQQMMYGFIFVMYAVTAGVLFYVMFNRYVVSVVLPSYSGVIRRERKKRRAEAAESLKEQQEVIDGGVELIKEQQKEMDGDQAKAEVSAAKDKEDEDVQKTSFEEPTVEEIKQLQEQPKKLIDKKTE